MIRRLLITAALLLLAPTSASAATLQVAPGAIGNCASSPCGSFNTAYQAAKPGDVVEVADGVYPVQNIVYQASKTSSDDVTFRPVAGAHPFLTGLRFGSAYDDLGGEHVTVQDMEVRGGGLFRRTVDVTLRNVRFHGAPFGAGNVELSFIGGEWGDPAVTNDGTHPEFTWYPPNRPGGGVMVRSDGLLLDGVHVHHIGRPLGASGVHTNCFHPQDGNNITVVNSHFDHCDVFDVLISPDGPSGPITNVTLAHNVFEASTNTGFSGSGDYSVMIDPQSHNVTGVHLWKNVLGNPFVTPKGRAFKVAGDKYGNAGAVNDSTSPLTALTTDPEGTTPVPTPTPSPTATPTATPSPTPTATPSPTPTPEPHPDCAPTCDQQIADLKAKLAHARALATELADALTP